MLALSYKVTSNPIRQPSRQEFTLQAVAIVLVLALVCGFVAGSIVGSVQKAKAQTPIERLCGAGVRVAKHGVSQC